MVYGVCCMVRILGLELAFWVCGSCPVLCSQAEIHDQLVKVQLRGKQCPWRWHLRAAVRNRNMEYQNMVYQNMNKVMEQQLTAAVEALRALH